MFQSQISSSSALTSETPRGGNINCCQRGADISERIHFKTTWGFHSAAAGGGRGRTASAMLLWGKDPSMARFSLKISKATGKFI